MKIVINTCYGGYSLSPLAIKRLAELNGEECYFFKEKGFKVVGNVEYSRINIKDISKNLFFTAFNIPNPNSIFRDDLTIEQKQILYRQHCLSARPENRADPLLIQVIEEFGTKASSGQYADLKIVEIPDGIDWEISEYDGVESVHEKHSVWY